MNRHPTLSNNLPTVKIIRILLKANTDEVLVAVPFLIGDDCANILFTSSRQIVNRHSLNCLQGGVGLDVDVTVDREGHFLLLNVRHQGVLVEGKVQSPIVLQGITM